jgi:anti-sigma regulatory factor (Ser/Thr protein kinase)/biotin operon repressor
MSVEFTKIKDFVEKHGQIQSQDVADMFSISRQASQRKLQQLVVDGTLVKVGKTRGVRYVVPPKLDDGQPAYTRTLVNKRLQEHEVLEDVFAQLPVLRGLPENVQSIFRYAFSEMLNNAIDHSGSSKIDVRIDLSPAGLVFEIRDFGIGVFRNVMKKFGLASETEAVGELMKGKTTTQPQAHSGEGIFFTSKIADTFQLESFGQALTVANTIPDVFFRLLDTKVKGTRVRFIIQSRSSKHLIDVFREYESQDGEHDFDKTKIHVKLFTYGTVHVSRSQAKRILEHLPERFTHVILDFDSVPVIGQAFADEVFRVFQRKHPHVIIEATNTNEAVQFMIDRVAT